MKKLFLILAIMTVTLVSVGQRANNTSILVNQYIYDLLSNNHKIFYGDGTGNVVELALGADGSYLMSNGATLAPSFETPGGTGDMEASTYDPTSVIGDVFDMDNMVEGTTSKIMTATERTNFTAGYNDKINSLAFTGTTTKTLTLTQQDAGTVSNTFTDEVDDADASLTNEGSLTVAAGAANTSIINSNTSGQTGVTISGDATIDVTESSNTITIASSMVQNVLNGAKTASFTHDAESASIGGYTLTTSGAVTVSIHNLESGMMGTIDLDIATNPSAITVATYSDAGSTGLTEVVIGSAIASEASKMTTISYSCVYNGTSTYVKLIYGQE